MQGGTNPTVTIQQYSKIIKTINLSEKLQKPNWDSKINSMGTPLDDGEIVASFDGCGYGLSASLNKPSGDWLRISNLKRCDAYYSSYILDTDVPN